MKRKRNNLVPIGEVVVGLDGPLDDSADASSPQAWHHFTHADQVHHS